jgi:hypothetical protein
METSCPMLLVHSHCVQALVGYNFVLYFELLNVVVVDVQWNMEDLQSSWFTGTAFREVIQCIAHHEVFVTWRLMQSERLWPVLDIFQAL